MTTLEELEKALQPLANRLPLVVDKGEIWTAEQTFKVDGDVDQYRSWLASCGSDVFGVLAVAAINALPGLIESARRAERLEASNADLKQALSSLVDRSTLSILARHQFEALLKGT
jgi:hypothetical protein